MQTIIVTGATSGIGLETARLLAQHGMRIIGVGRTEAHCAQAKQSILSSVPDAPIHFYAADLMQRREVLRLGALLAHDLEENSGGRFFALINNAGCARSWYRTTEDGYEQQFALNHLAGFLLTYTLLPFLLHAGGRVIMTGSQSHKGAKVYWQDVMLSRNYHPLRAYKQSKLCNLLFAQALNDRYAAHGIRAYVVDPGLVNTDIGTKEQGIVRFAWRFRKPFGVPPAIPAQTFDFLCRAQEHPPGLYYALCREKPYSSAVGKEQAERLFILSEQLCGITYGEVRA